MDIGLTTNTSLRKSDYFFLMGLPLNIAINVRIQVIIMNKCTDCQDRRKRERERKDNRGPPADRNKMRLLIEAS